jgi:hypothetical protein
MRQYLLVATLIFLVSCGPSVDVTPLAGAPALAPKTTPVRFLERGCGHAALS